MIKILTKNFWLERMAVTGHQRWLYAGIFALLVWQLTKFWGNWSEGITSIFYNIHAPIHEVGHTVAMMARMNETIVILAGSVFQIMTPVAIAIYFCVKGDYRALSLCLGWFGFAVIEMGIYMYDANLGRLNLVVPFMTVPEDAEGDFTRLFRMWDCLEQGCRIGTITAYIGYAFVFAALLLILIMFGFDVLASLNKWRKPTN